MAIVVLKLAGPLTVNNVEKENTFTTVVGTDTHTGIKYTISGLPAHIEPKGSILVGVDTSAPTFYSVKDILSIYLVGTGITLLKRSDGSFREKTEEDNKKCLEAENKAFERCFGDEWKKVKKVTGLDKLYEQEKGTR